MAITGFADPATESAALHESQLVAVLQRQGGEPGSGLKRIYETSKPPNEPRNLLDLARDPAADMRALLLASCPVTLDMARELALQRSVAVRDALMAQGTANGRIFLAAQKPRAEGAPCVNLSLMAH